MLKTFVEVTGDAPLYASCQCPTVISRGSNDRAGVFSSVETLFDF